jgi:EmrB/QacA subfamily drug resistance transporter
MGVPSPPSTVYQRRWWTLVAIAISVIIVVLDSSIVNIALPTLQRELGATISDLQWIISAYIMVFAGLMLTAGSLGDRLGRARMLQAGIIVFALASMAAAFSDSGTELIIWRAVMGVGGAMILPSTLAIITNVFPREERGRAIGVWAGLNGIGIALGPIIGGLIIENLTWRWMFFVNLPVAVVALVLGWFLIPNSRDQNPKRIDAPGTLLSMAALSTLIFGLIKSNDWGWTDARVIGSLGGGIVLVAAFILWERHTAHPMLEVHLFRNRRFSAGVMAVCLMSLGLVGITFTLTLYMQFVKGFSPLQTGVRVVPLALGMFIGATTADRLVRAVGTTKVMLIGFLGIAAVGAIASFWEVNTVYWQLGVVFACLGFSLGYVAAPASDAVMGALPEARAGVGSAMNTVSRMFSGSLGVAVLGSILSSIYSSSFNRAISGIPGVPHEIIGPASD